MHSIRTTRRTALVILAVFLGAFTFPPGSNAATGEGTLLVEYRLVHEEVDGGADSAVSPDGKWISFSHNKSGNREVYAVNTETGKVYNVTNSPEDEWEARWHPEGSHIVFTALRNGQNGVFIRDLKTDKETTVMSTKDGYEDYPSFSKDGKMVSFTAGPFGSREVFRWDWATGAITQITSGHDYVGSTNFSADGSKIVYHAYYGGDYTKDKSDIFVVDANGGKGVNITGDDDAWVYKAQWSPDGQWIVFSARYDTPNFNLWVMRPDGSDRIKLTDVAGEDFRWADWTRNGRLAWHGIKPQQGRLYSIDVATGERNEMAKYNDYIWDLSASPNGSLLTYEANGDIYTLEANPNASPRILTAGQQPRFSSDGKTISFIQRQGSKVGMAPVGGGEVVIVDQFVSWPDHASSGWSPDGNTLAVISESERGQDVTLISRDGTKKQMTDDGRRKHAVVWSSGGKHLIYAEHRENRVGYYITPRSVTDRLNNRMSAKTNTDGAR